MAGRPGERSPGSMRAGTSRLIHVTTSGLVFLRKLGVAATDKDIEFASGGMTGHAVGADYSADTGVVVLHAAVKVNGLQHDRPVVLTASHAVLDRPGQMVVLSQAKYVAVGECRRAEAAGKVRLRRRSMWWCIYGPMGRRNGWRRMGK